MNNVRTDAADAEQGGAGGADCARAGIAEVTLYRWRDEFIHAGKQALNGRGADTLAAKETARLNAQLAERDHPTRTGPVRGSRRLMQLEQHGSDANYKSPVVPLFNRQPCSEFA